MKDVLNLPNIYIIILKTIYNDFFLNIVIHYINNYFINKLSTLYFKIFEIELFQYFSHIILVIIL
jgi:hypothetical protein